MTTPTTIPLKLIAGDTAKWQRTLQNYPANEGWGLVYTLINATSKITITSTANGSDHLVQVPATTTDAWAAGSYSYREQAVKVDEAYTLRSGMLTVCPSFAAATLDGRSGSRVMLDMVEASLLKSATANVMEYTINGRSLKHYSLVELLQLRDKLKGEVAREDMAAKMASGLGGVPGRMQVRFSA